MSAFVASAHADAPIARSPKALKNRYIVTFKDSVSASQVNGLAKALTHQHGGRLLATMTAAIHGFGVELPEAAVQGLSRNPAIALIEEDQLIELASDGSERDKAAAPRFDFRGMKRPAPPIATSTTSCTWDASGYYVCGFTNDTFWNLDRIDNTGQLYSVKAYAYNSMGTNVRAYVVDSGVYADHSEFEGRVVSGANMMVDPDIADAKQRSDEEEPISALDYALETNPCFGWQTSNADAGAGHGTAVASVLGGNTTGVAKNVTIVPVKIVACNGEGSMLAMARGLDWIYKDMKCPNKPAADVDDPDTYPGCEARTNRAVVNMSVIADANFGNIYCEDPHASGGYSLCIPSIEHEVNTLIGGNIPVVVAAGNQNNGNCIKSPSRLGYGNEAAVPSTYRTITVGATAFDPSTYTDQRWSCVNTPAQCPSPPWNSTNDPGSNYGKCVSIWAPGWSVKVAGAAGSSSYRSAGQFSTGTSFATPLVTGAVARLLQWYPTLTAQQVWTELVNRANQRVNPPDFDPLSTVFNNKLVYMSPFE
jgi:subtilisin family serine protease